MNIREAYSDLKSRSGGLFALIFQPTLPPLFLMGAVLIAVLGNGVYDLLKIVVGDHLWSVIVIITIAVFGLFATVFMLYIELIRKFRSGAAYEGIILFLGRNIENAELSISHHIDYGGLRYCSVLVPDTFAVEASKLHDFLHNQSVTCRMTPFDITELTVDNISEIIIRELSNARSHLGRKARIVVDITSGTKEMIVGAVLACRKLDVPMQYLTRPLDKDGKVDVAKPGYIAFIQ